MAREEFDLGPSPADEDCTQVGTPDYMTKAPAECERYVALVRKSIGPEPEGAQLMVRTNTHEGTYLSVVVRFDQDNPKAMEHAFRCEDEVPTTWITSKDGGEANG